MLSSVLRDLMRRRLLPAAWWLASIVFLGAAFFLIARACGYDGRAVASYSLYFTLHVGLPGLAVAVLLRGRSLTWMEAIAFGVPTGFAAEVFGFLALSALNARAWLPALPLVWGTVAVVWWRRHGVAPLRWRVGRQHAFSAAVLSGLFLCTIIAAVSQMFSESPLVTGLPQRPIFHDWVYLVSRAAAIKAHWPLEDPSLAGTPLHYHYFMLVHVAAASWSGGIELTTVMLRLAIVPLGGVLAAQAFLLGRRLSRRVAGGAIAALLTVCVSGMSLRPDYIGRTDFLDLFVRWLYVSPTFFFGVIFFGVLLLVVAECDDVKRLRGRQIAWLALLSAVGTGAKGTVVPVVLAGLGLWAGWCWWRERIFPRRLVLLGVAMTVPFVAVYFGAMAAWGTGEAMVTPFRIYQITQFWYDYGVVWQRILISILPHYETAIWLGAAACALAVLAGTSGVRLLAVAYLVQGAEGHRTRLAHWLGATFVVTVFMGTFVHLDSNGELYVVLLMRLPLAALTGAFAVSGWARFRAWRRRRSETLHVKTGWRIRALSRLRTAGTVVALAAIALTFALQINSWFMRGRRGFGEWWQTSPRIAVRDDLLPLYETMRWVRANTEPNAVLLANAFTLRTMKEGRGISVDHTTVGVHYYYSALSERRLWIEGPSYQLDLKQTNQRLQTATEIFYDGKPPTAALFKQAPGYILLDHGVGDGARVALGESQRVFKNGRYEIYRVPEQQAVAMSD